MKIYAVQINPTVGALEENARSILQHYKEGAKQGADLVILPEMALTGYLPQDLLFSVDFLDAVDAHIEALVKETTADTALVLSVPTRVPEHKTHITTGLVDRPLTFNSVIFCANGNILSTHGKEHLFNYSVGDEKRVFAPYTKGHSPQVWKDVAIGFPICRDVWYSDVCDALKSAGADLLLSPNGSPYYAGKHEGRVNLMQSRSDETDCPALYLNLVGGQDDYLFDGRSFACSPNRTEPTAQLSPWVEDTIMLTLKDGKLTGEVRPLPDKQEDIYQATVMGLKDYARKNGFSKAVLGLSGGVDSALVATIAADALGAENVTGLLMPSDYSTSHSVDDALALATNLGINTYTFPIKALKNTFDATWEEALGHKTSALTEQNMQARLRGALVMAYSNQEADTLALTTGNKSEVAVGYCTLYGDMNGGYNPIKDLYKTEVFKLCDWINRDKDVIPRNILTKAPSAELAPEQKDSDSLPDYAHLDAVLKCAIENNMWNPTHIAQETHLDEKMVKDTLRLIRINEYKRYQGAPGPKLSKVAFGVDRRYPLTNKFNL